MYYEGDPFTSVWAIWDLYAPEDKVYYVFNCIISSYDQHTISNYYEAVPKENSVTLYERVI